MSEATPPTDGSSVTPWSRTPGAPPPPPSSPGSGLDLRPFYAYRFLVTAYLFVPAQVAFLLGRGLDLGQILLLNTVYNLVAVVFEVPTGALADRIGRPRAMAIGALTMAAGAAAYVLAGGFATFAVAEALFAIGMSMASGSDSAYLFDHLKARGQTADYARAEGTASAWKHVGTVAAFAAGGALATVNPLIPYALTSVVCLGAAWCALGLGEPRDSQRPIAGARDLRAFLGHMHEGVRVAFRLPRLLRAIVYSAMIFLLLRISLVLYQPYLASAGFDLAATGLVMAAVQGVAAVVSRFVGQEASAEQGRAPTDGAGRFLIDGSARTPRPLAFPSLTLVTALPLVLGLTYLAMAGTHVAFAAVALLMLQATVNGAYSPVAKSLVNREILDSGQRATVLSVESLVRRLTFAAFSAGLGLVIEAGSLPIGLIVCGIVGVVAALAIAARGRPGRPRLTLVEGDRRAA